MIDDTFTPKQVEKLEAIVSTMPSTTAALMALAVVLEGYDDAKGAALIREFAERFADHEEDTL